MTLLRPRVGNNLGEVNQLKAKVAELTRENERLKAENKRLSGNSSPGVQTRQCINCGRNLPDGPVYFPGYLELVAPDAEAEMLRHRCVYCR